MPGWQNRWEEWQQSRTLDLRFSGTYGLLSGQAERASMFLRVLITSSLMSNRVAQRQQDEFRFIFLIQTFWLLRQGIGLAILGARLIREGEVETDENYVALILGGWREPGEKGKGLDLLIFFRTLSQHSRHPGVRGVHLNDELPGRIGEDQDSGGGVRRSSSWGWQKLSLLRGTTKSLFGWR